MTRLMMHNTHIRALDRFFNRAMTYGLNPFHAMDRMLDSLTAPVPPADGTEFTLYEMKPTTYRVEHEKDEKGNVTVKYLVVDPEADHKGGVSEDREES